MSQETQTDRPEHDFWADERPDQHRLFRSSRDRMWAGVAGGMAEFFDVDSTLVRLLWVIATVVTAGLFVAIYLVLWVIMPADRDLGPAGWRDPASATSTAAGDAPEPSPYDWGPRYRHRHHYRYRGERRRSAGFVLIALGLLFLGAQSGIFRWINWNIAWAVVLIVIGAALLLRHRGWGF